MRKKGKTTDNGTSTDIAGSIKQHPIKIRACKERGTNLPYMAEQKEDNSHIKNIEYLAAVKAELTSFGTSVKLQ